jgi:hypothetical protein
MPDNFELDATALISGQTSAGMALGAAVALWSHGGVSWDGTNDNGQAVAGGTYYFKAEFKDQFGTIRSDQSSLQVMEPSPVSEIRIFNSAGELVRVQAFTGMEPMVNLVPRDKTLVIDLDTGLAGGATSGLGAVFGVQGRSGQWHEWAWDGRNNSGKLVGGGTYLVELVDLSGPGQASRMSLQMNVLVRGNEPAQLLAAGPNPLGPGQNLVVRLQGAAGNSGALRLSLYNLAGEQVLAHSLAAAGAGAFNVELALPQLSAGVYFLVLEDPGHSPTREIRKLAVLR